MDYSIYFIFKSIFCFCINYSFIASKDSQSALNWESWSNLLILACPSNSHKTPVAQFDVSVEEQNQIIRSSVTHLFHISFFVF